MEENKSTLKKLSKNRENERKKGDYHI